MPSSSASSTPPTRGSSSASVSAPPHRGRRRGIERSRRRCGQERPRGRRAQCRGSRHDHRRHDHRRCCRCPVCCPRSARCWAPTRSRRQTFRRVRRLHFVGLTIADQFIGTGAASCVFGDRRRAPVTRPQLDDRTTCVLFGDGAGAVVLGPAKDEQGGILSTRSFTDGSLASALHIPGGGSAEPLTPSASSGNATRST